ncbi:hypothetical protein OIV83_004537 [Microbotryomycetes sp. JL201]|nr:hypothetical protein OIV83_004537 [Microbotryomycetes sp. JL201]
MSVLFSLANLVAHAIGYSALSKQRDKRSQLSPAEASALDTLQLVYKAYSVAGINTWIWSSVFHTRDTNWTERADYFSAAGGMVCGLWMAVIRLSGMYKSGTLRRWQRSAWTTTCLLVFVMHCRHLTRGPRFDYTYNMRFNVVIALLQIGLWAAWSVHHTLIVPRRHARQSARAHRANILDQAAVMSQRPTPGLQLSSTSATHASSHASGSAPHALRPLLPLLLLPALSALELLDFEPVGPGNWRLLDAHALWHLSTVPVVFVWYSFLIQDVEWVKTSLQDESEKRLL